MPTYEEQQTLEATRKAAAASLAGGIIAAVGKPLSMQQAMAIFTDAYFTLFPERGNMRFDDWAQRHDSSKLYGG